MSNLEIFYRMTIQIEVIHRKLKEIITRHFLAILRGSKRQNKVNLKLLHKPTQSKYSCKIHYFGIRET